MFKIPSFDDFLADVGEEKMIKWYMTVDGIKFAILFRRRLRTFNRWPLFFFLRLTT